MDGPGWLVPYGDGEAEYIQKKSRFVANVFLVSSEEEALARIAETAKRHPGASHGVYAYDLKATNITRFSDAGEPKGTAGMPVLDVFRRRGLTCFCCVVTRYFGGILLGAGGLTRAYAAAAALALDAAGVARLMPFSILEIVCEYTHFEKIRAAFRVFDIKNEEAAYAADVTLSILLPKEQVEQASQTVRDYTAGRAAIRVAEEKHLPVKIDPET